MATQRRSWLARIGVVMAVAFGALVGVTTPAYADVSLQGASLNPNNITVGAESTFKFKLKADPALPITSVTVETTFASVAECIGTCSWGSIPVNAQGETAEITAKIKGLSAGQAGVRVEVSNSAVGSPSTLTVQAAQQTTGKIQGIVKNNADAKGIKGAQVALQDGNGKTHLATADNNGIFTFDGPGKKIAPGLIAISATKAPFTMVGGAPRTQTVNANQEVIGLELLMEDLVNSAMASARPKCIFRLLFRSPAPDISW